MSGDYITASFIHGLNKNGSKLSRAERGVLSCVSEDFRCFSRWSLLIGLTSHQLQRFLEWVPGVMRASYLELSAPLRWKAEDMYFN